MRRVLEISIRIFFAATFVLASFSSSQAAQAQAACDPAAACFDAGFPQANMSGDFYINGKMIAQNVNSARLVGTPNANNVVEVKSIKDSANEGFGDLYNYADQSLTMWGCQGVATPIMFYVNRNYVKGKLQISVASWYGDNLVADLFLDGVQVGTQVAQVEINAKDGAHTVEAKNITDPKIVGKYQYTNISQPTWVYAGAYPTFAALYPNRTSLVGTLYLYCELANKAFADAAKCLVKEGDKELGTIENYLTGSYLLSIGKHNITVSATGAAANKWKSTTLSNIEIFGDSYVSQNAMLEYVPGAAAAPSAGGAASTSGTTPNNPTNVDRVVLADYLMWYDHSTFDGNKTWDVPRDGPYNSDDFGIIQRHVAQAQQACLNGFAAHWYGPNEPRTTGNFNKLMQASAGTSLRHSIVIQTNILPGANNDAIADAVRYVMNNWSGSGNYLKLGGKPVIFFTDMPRPWGSDAAALDAWRQIRNAVDPQHTTIWMAEGLYPTFNPPFDGQYVYRIDHKDYPQSWLKQGRWASQLRQTAQLNNTYFYFADTIAAGFDDTKSVNAPGDLRSDAPHFARDRQGGQYYRETYNSALYTGGDFLLVKSFNEWIEGTQIEPGTTYGDLYLNLTCEFANGYRNK